MKSLSRSLVVSAILIALGACARRSAPPPETPSAPPTVSPAPPEKSTPAPRLKAAASPGHYDLSPSRGCDVRLPDGASPIQIYFADLSNRASTVGARNIFSDLVYHPDDLWAVDGLGRGVVHWLVENDRIEVVKALIAGGFYWGLALKDRDGRLPLHEARSEGMVDLLLRLRLPENNADRSSKRRWAFEFRDAAGRTPLQTMILNGNSFAARRVAIRLCGNMITRRLPWLGEDAINAVDGFGRSALHDSALTGDVIAAEALSDCSAQNFAAVDRVGRSALHYAALDPAFAVGTVIVDHLAEAGDAETVNLRDHAGNTALHLAYACRNARAIELLSHFTGARTDLVNSAGRRPEATSPEECVHP